MKGLGDLIGESPSIVALRAQVARLLQRQTGRRLPVLLLGETGTGKTVLARAMHHASSRTAEPFVSLNCAAIPETLLESELFGFERGAFTDARQAKPGLFQTANRGTLFLDEIGALSVPLQAKLLTALEEGTVRRLGSTRSEPVDVWIVAATAEDLAAAMRERRFREDLYHRLSALTLSLPALRERGDDILTLADHFLSRACTDYGQPPKRLTPVARDALRRYRWPGNVRELANLMERIAVLVEGVSVTAHDLGLPAVPSDVAAQAGDAEPGRSLRNAVGDFERSKLVAALESANGNLSRAATLLGMPRNTLRYRLERLGVRPEGLAAPVPPSLATDAETVGTGPTRKTPAAERSRSPLTFLWTSVDTSKDTVPLSEAHEGLDIVMEKIRAFGGRPEEIRANSVVASFGPDGIDESTSRALHTVLAIHKATEQDVAGDTPRKATRAAIHVGECEIEQTPAGIALGASDRRRLLGIVTELGERSTPDTVLVSQTAVPFVARQLQLRDVSVQPVGSRTPSGVLVPTPSIAYKPSIAVLPFRNLSGDPEQEYFGEGITEDIIGALSRLRWLFVIARTSTLGYKALTLDAREISTTLGVRYLLTGTVRRLGATLRVTADLIDGAAGNTIWADRYDGAVADLFEFQDRITARIVGTLDSTLRLAEAQRALQKRPERLDAYDCVLRAFPLIYRLTYPEFMQAGRLLEQAITLDPSFATGYAWRAWWYLWKRGQGWVSDGEADRREASRMADAALARDSDDPLALAISAHLASFYHRDCQTALERFERSLALNPNSALAWGLSGTTLCYVGEARVALDREMYALRLSPFDAWTFYFYGIACFSEMLSGHYESALEWGSRAREANPRFSANLRWLAATLALMDRIEAARQMAQEFLAIETNFSLAVFRKWYPLRESDLEIHVAALRKAGFPE